MKSCTGRVGATAAVALGIGALMGCSSTQVVPRRQSGIIVGSQGSGSEVVFAGVQVVAMGGAEGPEHARRDADLGVRSAMTAFEYDSWPQAPAPSLYWSRRLSLPSSPQQVLYFEGASQSGYRFRAWQAPCPSWP